VVKELNSGLPRTNPDSGRVEDLNQGPPDFKSSALNHSATPPSKRRGILKNENFAHFMIVLKQNKMVVTVLFKCIA